MITATAHACSLSALVADQFLIVAERRRDELNWVYMLPEREIVAFQAKVRHGDIVSVQRREADLGFVVLAKLAAVR